jgi:hypothetical protein
MSENLYKQLQRDMENDIQRTCLLELTEESVAECCFRIAFQYLVKLREMILKGSFDNKQEEICFFKKIKPLFSAQVEYFSLMHNALLFEQDELPENKSSFWQKELKRLERFSESNRQFISYFRNGETYMDLEFFVRNPIGDIDYYDASFATLNDGLAATLLAEEMYHVYVKGKLNVFPIQSVAAIADMVFNNSTIVNPVVMNSSKTV